MNISTDIIPESAETEGRNLFLLSFFDRDPLSETISEFGWRVTSARRGRDLRSRFLASNALIAVVDLRESADAGLEAIADLSHLSENNGVAILAIADQESGTGIASKCYDAGATYFHDAESNVDLKQVLKFAYRYAERMRGGRDKVSSFDAVLAQSDLEWSIGKSTPRETTLTPSLSGLMNSNLLERYPSSAIYRMLNPKERASAREAMHRMQAGSAQVAFSHSLAGKQVIHHLHANELGLHGRIEQMASEGSANDWTSRDILSGLRNESAARSWIGDQLGAGSKLGLIALGIKNFSTINVAYGRGAGDEVLRIIGKRLLTLAEEHVASDHMVARMDGQNFLVATKLDETSDQIAETAQHLTDKLFDPVTQKSQTIRVTGRVGTVVGSGYQDQPVLVRRASLALAEAMASDSVMLKQAGSSDKDILLEQELEADLDRALEKGEIVIALQPQMRVDTGQLVGAEALARWNHSKFGFLGAGTLFAVAERAGLKDQLSAQIINKAIETGAAWPSSLSFLRLSVNITAGDLADGGFINTVSNYIENFGYSPDQLTFEITESDLIEDIDSAAIKLRKLQEIGPKIAIDDFGTGYSSLAYLKKLPLDYLKIDSGLTDDISGSEKDQVVVKSIIDMAHSLNLSVIAEGVETEAQLALLAKQGCEFFQGFLRSGPLSPQEFEVFALKSD